MGLDNLIKIALTLTFAAGLTGNLPTITRQIQIAQVKLLQHSMASKWGSVDLLARKRAGIASRTWPKQPRQSHGQQ